MTKQLSKPRSAGDNDAAYDPEAKYTWGLGDIEIIPGTGSGKPLMTPEEQAELNREIDAAAKRGKDSRGPSPSPPAATRPAGDVHIHIHRPARR